jgi:hypothetical protein
MIRVESTRSIDIVVSWRTLSSARGRRSGANTTRLPSPYSSGRSSAGPATPNCRRSDRRLAAIFAFADVNQPL